MPRWTRRNERLQEQPVHDVAVDVGEAVVAPLEAVRQPRVVDPQAPQPGVAAGDYVVQFTKWVQPDGSPLPEKTPPHMVNAVNIIPPGWGGGDDAGPQTQIKVSEATPTLDFDIPGR